MLAAGARVGRYEVLESIGAGAMGQVFRARDSELERFVALKTLPEALARDPERLARFEREARVLASLNHPNIATLHEVVTVGDIPVLVLELVEGDTLAARIARGPLSIESALSIAMQIATALKAAHDRGIVHRDLKPANVKLRADGTVKLLDFGLAKVLATHADGAGEAEATVTALDLARPVLGTPAYMSPEQARGLAVDARTDIWAFGCVLYEMLTGRRAFAGERATDTLIRVIEQPPAFDALPARCPTALRRLLRRCLAKDAGQRLHDFADVRLELVDAAAGITDVPAKRARFKGRTWAAAVAVIAVGSAVWVGVANQSTPPVAARITRFAIGDGTGRSVNGSTIAVARDGRRIAYANGDGLMLRARDQIDDTRLLGAGTGEAPFFSPDGEWVGYTDWSVLRKVPAAGGQPTTIVEVGPAATAAWGGNDIFVADVTGLLRVRATDGAMQRIKTGLASGEQPFDPQYLGERQALLFTVMPSPSQTPGLAANAPTARVEALDLVTGERHVVIRGGGRARYLPTGHLVYVSRGTLYATAFDLQSLTARGKRTPVLETDGDLEFAVADEGTLVYRVWRASTSKELVWVDREGREDPIAAPPMNYVYARLSPDGQRVGLDLVDDDNRDIWMFDLRRGALERFTRDLAGNPIVAFSPDGRDVVFGSDRFGVTNMFRQASDGSGTPERLLESTETQIPITYAPDGRLLFSQAVPGHQRDIYALSLDGEPRGVPLVATPANELTAEISPDGHWIAYDSDESGHFEVYVRPYPDTESGGRWQISSDGGRQPLWSHDGRELFYRAFDGALMSVAVSLSPTFVPGRATKLFQKPEYAGSGSRGGGRTYDIAPDDSRFIMIKDRPTNASKLVVVLDWFADLERLAPLADARASLAPAEATP